jgi:DNA invertase Pin-like site-specific DNA recombinase
MNSTNRNRALFYTRDSGGKHETTPGQYVEWAINESQKRGLRFNGTPDTISSMIQNGECHNGDIYLDYDVSGNVMDRPGLVQLISATKTQRDVAAVFIPRRDRLARPNNVIDGLKIESEIREAGVTIVFMDAEAAPLGRGRRQGTSDMLAAVIAYDSAGKFREDLARKVLYAQMTLAQNGYSTGGRAPYGFRRWLVNPEGERVRELADKEHVRRAFHHVVWLPGPDHEIDTIKRILTLLETNPASRVAEMLTREGVPSPDSGRFRTDQGVRHRVSGVWHQSTIVNIARNPLLRAMTTYGRRSMGDQLRCGPDGPRELDDADFIADNKPKVIRNPNPIEVKSAAEFDPLVDLDRHDKLIAKLNARAGTQRGKPRARDPNQNPLGTRVIDMACGWPMYREPHANAFRYKCGLYNQSHGAECKHNHVDGIAATAFALGSLRQILLSPGFVERIEVRLLERARHEQPTESEATMAEIDRLKNSLEQINERCEQASKNLAWAKSQDDFDTVSSVRKGLIAEKSKLEYEIRSRTAKASQTSSGVAEVESTIKAIRSLVDLAQNPSNLGLVRQLFEITNCRLFLDFEARKKGKRILNRLRAGVITFGDAAPPIEIYRGPTGRRALESQTESTYSNQNDNSLRNVNRGDRIRTCDL